MPMSSTSRTTMTMNSIIDAGLPCSASVTPVAPTACIADAVGAGGASKLVRRA
jgi:hypothetical protein